RASRQAQRSRDAAREGIAPLALRTARPPGVAAAAADTLRVRGMEAREGQHRLSRELRRPLLQRSPQLDRRGALVPRHAWHGGAAAQGQTRRKTSAKLRQIRGHAETGATAR